MTQPFNKPATTGKYLQPNNFFINRRWPQRESKMHVTNINFGFLSFFSFNLMLHSYLIIAN